MKSESIIHTPILPDHKVAQMCYTSVIDDNEVSMAKVKIRKQGGAAIITIPAHILEALHLAVGNELSLNITKQGVLVKPVQTQRRKRRRYTLAELFKGVTPKMMKKLQKETAWIRDLPPVGREHR